MTRAWNLRARRRNLSLGLVLSGCSALLLQVGCAESSPVEFVMLPDGSASGTGGSGSGSGGSQGAGGSQGTGGSDATGGTTGTGGVSGTGGTTGTGGTRATGGTTGSGGTTATGGVTGTGGTRATGGTTGSGGTTATGGTTGTGGTRATGGTSGGGGAGGAAAPTFTQLYQTILSVSCTGSQCHNPGTQGGVSFASQSSAYSAVSTRVVKGNANSSSFYTLVNGGRMPPGNKLPAAQLSQIAAWINAGAMNN